MSVPITRTIPINNVNTKTAIFHIMMILAMYPLVRVRRAIDNEMDTPQIIEYATKLQAKKEKKKYLAKSGIVPCLATESREVKGLVKMSLRKVKGIKRKITHVVVFLEDLKDFSNYDVLCNLVNTRDEIEADISKLIDLSTKLSKECNENAEAIQKEIAQVANREFSIDEIKCIKYY